MAEQKKLSILVAGVGTISSHWLEYTLSRADTQIAGIVEINRERAEAAQRKYGFSCPIFGSLDEALGAVRADILYDLTYVTTHSQIVVKALKAGMDVFGEKPMTLTREEAELMVKTAEETGRTYNVMQNRRYQQPVQAMRELVRSGRLGKIWMISADIFVGEDLNSIRNLLEKPMLQDNAIHSFDQARFITGEDPVSVYCHSYNPEDSKYKGDAAGSCVFEMSGGAVFVYNCVMGAEGLNTSWESSWRVIGSKGSLVWDGFGQPRAEIRIQGAPGRQFDAFTPETQWHGKEQHFGCLEEMFDSYLAKRPSATDCHDNYKSISMSISSVESARLQKKIPVL